MTRTVLERARDTARDVARPAAHDTARDTADDTVHDTARDTVHDTARDTVRTARLTGLSYLCLAITGGLGFLLIRQQLFVPGDAAATLANLVAREGLARAGVALELGIVLTQALAALLFFKLFRRVDAFAAGAVAAFGLMNAVAIVGSAALLGTAITLATDPALVASTATPAAAHLMYVISDNVWSVGNLFFGLWLVPMGWLVIRSGWMSTPLGWLLIIGGFGYVLAGFGGYLFPTASLLTDALVVPATVGELWMIAYLLVRGVNRRPAGSGQRHGPVIAGA